MRERKHMRTDRTILRPWNEGDAKDLYDMFASPQAMRFWNAPPARSLDDVRAVIARSTAAPAEVHKGFSIVLRETGCAVGFVNYHHREPANRRLEIGYILSPAHQGRGLAYEAVSIFVGFCFDELASNRIEAFTDPKNVASGRLLERLGFKQEGGPLRQRIVLGNGTFGDQIIYALLATTPDERTNDRSRRIISCATASVENALDADGGHSRGKTSKLGLWNDSSTPPPARESLTGKGRWGLFRRGAQRRWAER